MAEHQLALAESHNNIGTLFSVLAKYTKALIAYNSAKSIQEKLYESTPSKSDYRSALDLLRTHMNIGSTHKDMGNMKEAIGSYYVALKVCKQVLDKYPSTNTIKNYHGKLHNVLGVFLFIDKKDQEAMAEFMAGREIQEDLLSENPTVAEYQNDLASCHNNIGMLLAANGSQPEAMIAYESALKIRQSLVLESPSVTEYRHELAQTYRYFGNLLRKSGLHADAIQAHLSAQEIHQQLLVSNQRNADYLSNLVETLNELAKLFIDTGDIEKAMNSYKSSLEYCQTLVDDYPSVASYQKSLAHCYKQSGLLLHKTGRLDDAVQAYESALKIKRESSTIYSEPSVVAKEFGGLLNNLAVIQINYNEFDLALKNLHDGIAWQRMAMASDPSEQIYRQYVSKYLRLLIKVATALGNQDELLAAQRELDELNDTDPGFAAIAARLNAVINGEPVQNNLERLALAQRAYDTGRYAHAARLWSEALESDPSLANDRHSMHSYNAACAAALVASGSGRDNPPDEAARTRLRSEALSWLLSELKTWTQFHTTANADQKSFLLQTLKHWQEDSDLASVRDAAALEKLPESERHAWEALWKGVA